MAVVEAWLNLQPTTPNRHGRCARRDNRTPSIGESQKPDEKWSWRSHHPKVSPPATFLTLPPLVSFGQTLVFHGCLLTASDPESAWPLSTWRRCRRCRRARLAENTSVFWRTMWVFDLQHSAGAGFDAERFPQHFSVSFTLPLWVSMWPPTRGPTWSLWTTRSLPTSCSGTERSTICCTHCWGCQPTCWVSQMFTVSWAPGCWKRLI